MSHAETAQEHGQVRGTPTMMINNSAKVIHVGGTMLVPGMPAEIDSDWLANEQVQLLMTMPIEEGSSVMALAQYTEPAPGAEHASAEHGVQESAAAATNPGVAPQPAQHHVGATAQHPAAATVTRTTTTTVQGGHPAQHK